MNQKKKDFLAENIKSGAEIIADGAVFCFRIDEKISQFLPDLSDTEREELKTRIILMSTALMFVYGMDREYLETKISYGRKISKQDKKERIDYISIRFSIDRQLAQKQIEKNIKSLRSLGKIEKKTPEDLEKKIKELLNKNLF